MHRRAVLAAASVALTKKFSGRDTPSTYPLLTEAVFTTPAYVGGYLTIAAFDTGAERTFVSKSFAKKAGLTEIGDVSIGGFVGVSQARTSKPVVVDVLGELITLHAPIVIDMPFLDLFGYEVLLGGDCFEARALFLDAPDNAARWIKGALRSDRRVNLQPAGSIGGSRSATVQIEGVSVTALLDTGNQLPLGISRKAALRMGLLANRRVSTASLVGVGGYATSEIFSVAKLKIGSVMFRDIPCTVYDQEWLGTDVNIGFPIFSRMGVILDYASSSAEFIYNARVDRVFRRDFTGVLFTITSDKKVVITGLAKGSPLEKSALQVGDEIDEFDDEPLSKSARKLTGLGEGERFSIKTKSGIYVSAVSQRYY